MPDVNGRIVMMNGNIYGWGPMYGAVTDFHVWDRLIDEVNDYPLLSTNHTPGNIISWETAVVETDLLVEHSEVLFSGNPQFEMFREVKSSEKRYIKLDITPENLKSHILTILHPSNLALFQSYTLPILHASN